MEFACNAARGALRAGSSSIAPQGTGLAGRLSTLSFLQPRAGASPYLTLLSIGKLLYIAIGAEALTWPCCSRLLLTAWPL